VPVAARAPVEPGRSPGVALRYLARTLVTVVVCALLGAAAVWAALPWYVRRTYVAQAAAHGIALAIDDVKVQSSGFRLMGVRATSPFIAGARVGVPEIEVEMSGLSPQKMTAHGAQLALEGRWSAVGAAFAKWRSSPGGGESGGWAPASLSLDGSRVVWQGPLGENARIDAADVRLEVAWHDRDATLRAHSDKVTMGVPGGSLGPWSVDLDKASDTSRMRVALDPGVPEACTVLVVGDEDRTTSIDVVVPRSPLARLGVPPQLLGLRGSQLQVAMTAHYAALGPTRSSASAQGGVYGIELPGTPRSVDVAWDAAGTGDPREGIDVSEAASTASAGRVSKTGARLAAGPLVGTLTGTLKAFDDGFRLDLAWRAGPVPCAAFDAPLGVGQPFDIAYELRKLAEATGHLAGDVSATGTLAFDSRDLGATKADFAPEVRCRASLFGR